MTTIHATETPDALFARIDTLLDQANEKRRVRIMRRHEAVAMLKDVADGHPFSWDYAGTVANAYTQPAVTTFMMAARVDGRIYLGITTTTAKGTPTPGRGWKSLQPWGESGPKGDAEPKWLAWTSSPDVIAIEAAEIDAMIEAEVEAD